MKPNAVTGDEAVLIGEGGKAWLGDLGPGCVCNCGGREGSDGPDSGECCRREGEGECNVDEPAAEDRVEVLKGWTGLMLGLRMGNGDPAGEDPMEARSLPPPALVMLSFLNRDANSSFPEPADRLEDDPSEIFEAAPESNPEVLRGRSAGNAMVRLLGLGLELIPGNVALGLDCTGRTKRSATEVDGGERGKDVLSGKLLGGEVVRESRC